jgi:hypothetical protein
MNITPLKKVHKNDAHVVICGDSVKIISKMDDNSMETVCTGIPDMDEVQMEYLDYIQWVQKVADLLFQKLASDQYAIFIHTDRKYNGSWIDKSYFIEFMAQKHSCRLLWKKIVIYQPPDTLNLYRPTYGTILCFAKGKKSTCGKAFPDVIQGKTRIYKNGFYIEPLIHIMNFLREKNVRSIIDPFAGRGTIAIVASKFQIHVVMIEISKELCQQLKNIY